MGRERASDDSLTPGRLGGWLMVGLIGAFALAGAIILVVEIASMAGSAFDVRPSLRVRRLAAVARHQNDLISPVQMDSADADVREVVSRRVIPGATLAIGTRGKVVQLAGYGRVGWFDRDAAASPDSTMYDLASLTKAVATTSAVLLLVQDGRIDLDDPVQRWLPEFDGLWKDRVTWRDLLTHSSGLPPAGHIHGSTPADRLHSLLRTKLDAPPGTEVQYSDVSFIVLWAAAQRVAGEPLPNFLARRIWRPLGMNSTAFWPGEGCTRCAPTLTLHTGEPYRGKPSDPIAHKIGIPVGNAGLFSTAHDLGRFTAMIANGGVLDGVRIFRPDLVRLLFHQVPGAGHRTMGWEAFCPAEHPTQQQACAHPIAYGHTGWTGTSLWVDPTRGVWAIILSNRSYDVKRPPPLDELREDVFLDVATRPLPPRSASRPQSASSRDTVAAVP